MKTGLVIVSLLGCIFLGVVETLFPVTTTGEGNGYRRNFTQFDPHFRALSSNLRSGDAVDRSIQDAESLRRFIWGTVSNDNLFEFNFGSSEFVSQLMSSNGRFRIVFYDSLFGGSTRFCQGVVQGKYQVVNTNKKYYGLPPDTFDQTYCLPLEGYAFPLEVHQFGRNENPIYLVKSVSISSSRYRSFRVNGYDCRNLEFSKSPVEKMEGLFRSGNFSSSELWVDGSDGIDTNLVVYPTMIIEPNSVIKVNAQVFNKSNYIENLGRYREFEFDGSLFYEKY